MKHIVHFAKILFAQTVITAICLLIICVAVWLSPDCVDTVTGAARENFDITGNIRVLVSEVKALLLN